MAGYRFFCVLFTSSYSFLYEDATVILQFEAYKPLIYIILWPWPLGSIVLSWYFNLAVCIFKKNSNIKSYVPRLV